MYNIYIYMYMHVCMYLQLEGAFGDYSNLDGFGELW